MIIHNAHKRVDAVFISGDMAHHDVRAPVHHVSVVTFEKPVKLEWSQSHDHPDDDLKVVSDGIDELTDTDDKHEKRTVSSSGVHIEDHSIEDKVGDVKEDLVEGLKSDRYSLEDIEEGGESEHFYDAVQDHKTANQETHKEDALQATFDKESNLLEEYESHHISELETMDDMELDDFEDSRGHTDSPNEVQVLQQMLTEETPQVSGDGNYDSEDIEELPEPNPGDDLMIRLSAAYDSVPHDLDEVQS